jgi:hypothetical protein
MVMMQNIDREELIMGTPVYRFYDFEIALVIAEYLAVRDIASKAPAEVAREIVAVARFAVPQDRKVGEWKPSDRHKASVGIELALRKLVRHRLLDWPSRWLKKHFNAFAEFATKDGRLERAEHFCFRCQVNLAERVIEAFLDTNGLGKNSVELRREASTVILFLDELRGYVPVVRCPECYRRRLARWIAKTRTADGS